MKKEDTMCIHVANTKTLANSCKQPIVLKFVSSIIALGQLLITQLKTK